MMNKSKIEWCEFSWNPVTGCRHDCPYCYARRQARRFCGDVRLNKNDQQLQRIDAKDDSAIWQLREPFRNSEGKTIPLPAGFAPTLHEYRLPLPAQKKKPANIFVVSMGDLFGKWVPDSWIKATMDACAEAPWHNYLFLTKDPERYCKYGVPLEPNMWYGTSITNDADADAFNLLPAHGNTFVSIEPLHSTGIPENHMSLFSQVDWIILGAETGPRASHNKPKREWIQDIVDACREKKKPLFMKNNLLEVWEDPLIQQYPPSLQRKEVVVPHCQDCEHHRENERHYDSQRGVMMNHLCRLKHKRIPGRDIRTSPAWCPQRGEK